VGGGFWGLDAWFLGWKKWMAVCGGCGGGGCMLGGTVGPFLSPATSSGRRWTPDGASGPEREGEQRVG